MRNEINSILDQDQLSLLSISINSYELFFGNIKIYLRNFYLDFSTILMPI